MTNKIGYSDILTAFDYSAVGSKIVSPMAFMAELDVKINETDFSECRQPGQAYIELPGCKDFVSAGVGKRSLDPNDYLVREYRGKVGLYLKRHMAAEVDKVAAVVYTTDAYYADPDITEEEVQRVQSAGFTHVLVAVLASAKVPSTLTPGRFVHNLAGGNNEALRWSADEIRQKAKEIADYSSEWCVVADPPYRTPSTFTF